MAYRNRSLKRSRRGVLLLVVLSLLVMFLLAGMTFIVVASSFKKSTVIMSRHEQVGDTPENILDSAMYQLVRGTENPSSVVAGHDLLGDLYGQDGFVGHVLPIDNNIISARNPVEPADPLFRFITEGSNFELYPLAITIDRHLSSDGPYAIDPSPPPLAPTNRAPIMRSSGHFNGCVLTMTSGRLAGESLRIVKFDRQTEPAPLITSVDDPSGIDLTPSISDRRWAIVTVAVPRWMQGTIQGSDRFVVNGKPFSGMGSGFDTEGVVGDPSFLGGPLNAIGGANPFVSGVDRDGNIVASPEATVQVLPGFETWAGANAFATPPPVSLLPNRIGVGKLTTQTPLFLTSQPTTVSVIERHVPHLDEAWDAPDLENMILSSVRLNSTVVPLNIVNDDHIIPSFHRPELMSFWFNKLLNDGIFGGLSQQDAALAFEFPYGLDARASWDPRWNGYPTDVSTELLPPATAEFVVALKRTLTMRPLREDNPFFTGSNPNYHSILSGMRTDLHGNGIEGLDGGSSALNLSQLNWDVDNDGDGLAESVWADFGFSTMRMADGRVYKPLIAVHCQDLDRRVNVNTSDRWAVNTFHNRIDPVEYFGVSGGSNAATAFFGVNGMLAATPSTLLTSTPFVTLDSKSHLYVPTGLTTLVDADTRAVLPHGMGFGPAEVAPPVFDDNNGRIPWFTGQDRFLLLEQRNRGLFDLNGDGYAEVSETAPGRSQFPIPLLNVPTIDDDHYVSGAWKTAGIPNIYEDITGLYDTPAKQFPSGYRSPPDVLGRSLVALSHAGQPLFSSGARVNAITNGAAARLGFPSVIAPNIKHSDAINDPYEINLVDDQAADSRFTEADLEPVLRAFDADAQLLSQRLVNSAPGGFSFPNLIRTRNIVTTRSFEVPALPAVIPEALGFDRLPFDPTVPIFDPANQPTLRTLDARPVRSIVDLFEARLLSTHVDDGRENTLVAKKSRVDTWPSVTLWTTDGDSNHDGITNERDIEFELAAMIPFELRRGLKMDLNRPFGDGIDNDANGIVDEPGEVLSLPNFRDENQNGTIDDIGEDVLLPINLVNDDPVLMRTYQQFFATSPTNAEIQDWYQRIAPARQLYARHLYCLMMFLKQKDLKDPNTAAPIDDDLYTARLIAQWAINAVDFRDPDSICTPFEFDVNPYDGWDVDGDLETVEGKKKSAGSSDDTRMVVWGMERPQLLISETLAFHDRRTQDKDSGDGIFDNGAGTDSGFDQVLRPESGVFIELMNPGLQGNRSGPESIVRLGQRNSQGLSSWRMVFAEKSKVDRDPHDELAPTEFQLLNEDRVLYFSNPLIVPAGQKPAESAEKFYPDTDIVAILDRPIRPGRFCVIGSSGQKQGDEYITKMGRAVTDTDATTFVKEDSRCIVLNPFKNLNEHQIEIYNDHSIDVPDPNNGEIAPALAFPISLPRSLSITDPEGGYPGDGGVMPTPPVNLERTLPTPSITPLDLKAEVRTDGTTTNYRTVYLQRLAHPLRPWNEKTNPYLTIDSMPIDMTAFNGVEKGDPNEIAGDTRFASRQRGDNELSATTDALIPRRPRRWLWKREVVAADGQPGFGRAFVEQTNGSIVNEPAYNEALADQNANFVMNFDLTGRHKMWFIDRGKVPDVTNVPLNLDIYESTPRQTPHTLGYMNAAYQPTFTNDVDVPGFVGLTSTLNSIPATKQNVFDTVNPRAFPWLNWNNRPFVNSKELLFVPRTNGFQFGVEYSAGVLEPSIGDVTPFRPEHQTIFDDKASGSFGHLLNFFSADPNNSANFGRLFDFVEVRSPYVGTDTWGAQNFAAEEADGNNADGFGNIVDQRILTLGVANGYELSPLYRRPPFNYLSAYRNPGKINLNTVSDYGVWFGLNRYFPAWANATKWNELNLSRQGFVGSDTGLFPTFFSNPFRPSVAGTLMPRVQNMQRAAGIEGTELRPSNSTKDPLLSIKEFANQTVPYQRYLRNADYARNPFFRYQGLTRLDNLTSNQSNVYALWMTVGYFEVDPETGQLGEEIGIETGDIKRHRAFYIIDRSVPVAFEPGKNHNVDKAVILRRMIE